LVFLTNVYHVARFRKMYNTKCVEWDTRDLKSSDRVLFRWARSGMSEEGRRISTRSQSRKTAFTFPIPEYKFALQWTRQPRTSHSSAIHVHCSQCSSF